MASAKFPNLANYHLSTLAGVPALQWHEWLRTHSGDDLAGEGVTQMHTQFAGFSSPLPSLAAVHMGTNPQDAV